MRFEREFFETFFVGEPYGLIEAGTTSMNIVLVIADQLSAKWLSCYGTDAAHTPNLDRLAARGTRYTHCYANNPVCMPSRASLFTGRSPQHHGLFYNGWELGTDCPPLPAVLQGAGFETVGIGKFHLQCQASGPDEDLAKYGFDRFEVTEDIRCGDWLNWVEANHPDWYSHALATSWTVEGVSEYGPERRNLVHEIEKARRTHPYEVTSTEPAPTFLPEAICQTHWITDRALSFLHERHDQPFFLNVSYVDPHDPYDPPARYLDCIDADRIPRPVHCEDPRLEGALGRFRSNPFVQRHERLAEDDWITIRRHYLASLAFVDEQVGRLLDCLEERDLWASTCVIFTSDHGDMLGDHGLPTKGAWHLDACIRVPLILAGPGIPEGRVEQKRVVTNLDIFPTVTALADCPCNVPLEGRNLVRPPGEADTSAGPNAALVETYGTYGDLDPALRARTVVTPEARLTLFGDGSGMLFNLSDDPDETINRFADDNVADLRDELRNLMLDMKFRQDVPLPNRNRHPWAPY